MLPLISSAISQKNHGLVKKYITQSLRYVIMILLPIMALISAYADQIINLLYSIEFTSAGSILKILIKHFKKIAPIYIISLLVSSSIFI